jgi:hypothetical protein
MRVGWFLLSGLSCFEMNVCDSRSIGPIGLWLDMWGSNPCPIIPYVIVPHEGFEPLTQDSMSNPLTNCTILGRGALRWGGGRGGGDKRLRLCCGAAAATATAPLTPPLPLRFRLCCRCAADKLQPPPPPPPPPPLLQMHSIIGGERAHR